MDAKNLRLYKDVIAYLPIRKYRMPAPENETEFSTFKRLVFLVIPDNDFNPSSKKRLKPSDFQLLKAGIKYEIPLFNKPYGQYLYRDGDASGVNENEYEEWQYHHFDFYQSFRPNDLLKEIINAVLLGKLQAFDEEDSPMSRTDFIRAIQKPYFNVDDGIPSDPDPESLNLENFNSVVFNEDWYINPDNLVIYKEINSLTVIQTMAHFDNYTGEFIQEKQSPAFTIRFK